MNVTLKVRGVFLCFVEPGIPRPHPDAAETVAEMMRGQVRVATDRERRDAGMGAPTRASADRPSNSQRPEPSAYERLRPLGEGSFGSVSLVKHHASGKLHVMKEVKLVGLNPKALQRSRDEAKFLRRLHHPQ